MALRLLSDETQQKTRQKGQRWPPFFSPKAGSMRRPQKEKDIGRQIDQFVEQNAGFASIRSISSVASETVRAEVSMLSSACRRLIIIADPGERLQRAGARLGVMALGVAALADFRRRCDIDLAERGVGDAAGGGTIIRRR